MQYTRSGTALDEAGQLMPQRLLGVGRFSARGLNGMGETDEYGNYLDTSAGYDPSAYFPITDAASAWPTDPVFSARDFRPSPPALSPAIMTSSATDFQWSQLPAMARDLFIAYKQGDIQSKLLDINVQRARQGLPPLNAAAYAPGVNVGLNPATQTFLGVGVGTLALAGGALYFLTRRKSSRRR